MMTDNKKPKQYFVEVGYAAKYMKKAIFVPCKGFVPIDELGDYDWEQDD